MPDMRSVGITKKKMGKNRDSDLELPEEEDAFDGVREPSGPRAEIVRSDEGDDVTDDSEPTGPGATGAPQITKVERDD
ncbi:hypothetical protein PM023_17155 [Halorubrum ezzemoulense]|jgi:hypothetical protein|uniref:hypothetical protein n=1 Tax=Halorubrum ezzemoulense TaxID=337243 RepID=UPI0023303510|nr:hypothetical protein [Halorubrum ezzemoulense]MDB2226365.1 hypothetical protein [Halorubrum ezzemoulense]